MQYQIQQLAEALGTNASLLQYPPSVLGYVTEQAELLHEYVEQFLLLIILLWSKYRRVQRGDQWLEAYIETSGLKLFPMLFRGQHVE